MRHRKAVRRLLVMSCAAVSAAIVASFGVLLWLAVKYDQFRQIPVDERYACREITGIMRGEDLAVDWPRQQAFVSASNGLHRIDLAEAMTVTNITPSDLPVELKPHGLSLHAGSDGARTLFVINHASARESVLIFEISKEGALKLSTEISDPALYDPNDLTAVGPRQFYLTNSYTTQLGKQRFASLFSVLRVLSGGNRTGNVVYFDGARFRTAVDGLAHPNGINHSPDRLRIYVSETTAKRVSTFSRNPRTHALSLRARIKVPGAPDNIDVSPEGGMFVAALPHLLETASYVLYSRPKYVPSQVVTIVPDANPSRVTSLWSDDGTQMMAATIVAPFAKAGSTYQFLVGSGAADHLLSCTPRRMQNDAPWPGIGARRR